MSTVEKEGRAPARHTPASARVAVLVLGMHRSGTSLLARLLAHYGCDLPQNLLPGNAANAKGYWEPAAVIALNDALLASGGSSWHDWLPFNVDWFASPRQPEYLARAVDVLRTEFGGSGLFVLKDPRICRIVPFWRAALAQAGVTPAVVMPVRHPALVARSIALRDHILPSVGVLLWARHVLDAEAASRDLPRAFLTYQQMLADWPHLPDRLAQTLGLRWPDNGPASRAAQASFVDPAMAHGEAALLAEPAHQLLPPLVERLWTIMARWAEDGEDVADHAVLDRLRAELDGAGAVTGDAIVVGMNTRWMATELEQKFAVVEQQLADDQHQLAQRDDAVAAMQAAVSAAQAEAAAAGDERDATARQLAELAARHADASATLDQLSAQAEQLNTRIQTAEARDADLTAQLQTASETVAAIAAERAAAQAEARQQAARADALDAAMGVAQARAAIEHGNLVAERANLAAERDAATARAEAMAAQVLLLDTQLHAAVTAARIAETRCDAAQAQAADLRAQLNSTESNLRQRYAEIDQLRYELDQAHLKAMDARGAEQALAARNAALAADLTAAQDRAAVMEAAATLAAEAVRAAEAAREALLQEAEVQRGHLAQMESERTEAARQARKSEALATGLRTQDVRIARLTEEVEQARAQLDAHMRLTAEREEQVRQAEREAATRQAQQHDAAIRDERARNAAALHDATAEVARVRGELDAVRNGMEAANQRSEWLQAAHVAVLGPQRWWLNLLPFAWRLRMAKRRLARRNLFDAEAYVARYPDVASSGIDPLLHYVRHGMAEGRSAE